MEQDSQTNSICIGKKETFTSFPAPLQIAGEMYFLTFDDRQYRLLSSLCPHAGGQVTLYQAKLVCPLHMWMFDCVTGDCLTVRDAYLDQYPVLEKNGELFVEMQST